MACLEFETASRPGRVPAGLRRATPEAARADLIARRFEGLPEGVTRWRLAAASRAAARKLGLNAGMLALLEHYIDITWDVDWTAGAEPVITRPLIEIAEHMGRSERQVRNIERALAARGLLVWRDSGNHHRKGRRDRATGRFRYAYGPSLAPLAARAGEIIALAANARRELAELRRLRVSVSALRRRVRAELAEADPARAASAAAAYAALPARNPAGATCADLAAQVAELKRILRRLQTAETGETTPEISAMAEKNRSHRPDTSEERSMNGSYRATGSAAGDAPPTPAKRIHFQDKSVRRNVPTASPRSGIEHISLNMAAAAAGPRIRFYLEHFGETWPGLVAAAQAALPDIGLDQEAWGHACARLGRNGAAVATLVVERGVDRDASGAGAALRPVARPSAYLRAMVDRAAEGRLNLHRSVHALMRRRTGSAVG